MSSRSVGLLVLLRGGKRLTFDNVVSFSFNNSTCTMTVFYSKVSADGHSVSCSSELPILRIERMALI